MWSLRPPRLLFLKKRETRSSMRSRIQWVLLPLAMSGCTSGMPAGRGVELTDAQSDAALQADANGQADAAGQRDAGGVEASVPCEAGASTTVSSDGGACFIDLNRYDRSCSVDSDCVSTIDLGCAVPRLYVRGGDFCDGCNCNTGSAINQSAVAQYIADVSGTPEGAGQIAFPVCNCPPTAPPAASACIRGTCGGVADAGFSE
jgi:hypothetical protein